MAAGENGEDGDEDEAAERHGEIPEAPAGEAEADPETVVIEQPRAYTEGASSMGSPSYPGDETVPYLAKPDAAVDVEASPDPDRDTLAEVAARQPEPEPVAVVLTPPDPDRPKRGGWWSKAKSALSGS